MESWLTVFRKGIAHLLSTKGLTALLEGLRTNSKNLIQGATCNPPPLACVSSWQVEAGDAIVYAYWQGDRGGDCTVAEGEEAFAKVCYDCDTTIGEPAVVRKFLNWWDDSPRPLVLAGMIEEVSNELARRMAAEDGLPPFESGTPAGIIADWVEDFRGEKAAAPYRFLLSPAPQVQ